MRSSTFSSDTVAGRLPRLPWATLLCCALALAAAFVLAMEFALAMRGFRPTIVDSQAQWEKQRARAAALGNDALILVGDSRMQTDFDLAVLHDLTGLTPVELGIDGSSFLPVFAGLAHDEDIKGTILVGFSEAEVTRWNQASASARYEADYESAIRVAALPSYRNSEPWLDDRLHALLASYADGARPLSTLLLRLLDKDATPQYIVTQPDRSRLVDYSQANLRSLRYKCALFELEGNIEGVSSASLDEREQSLRKQIDMLKPVDASGFKAHVTEIDTLTRTIQKRGGRVIFVKLPVSGYIADIDARSYPREFFWDEFAVESSAHSVHFDDYALLQEFVPPDGLHLDGRDRARFTTTLAEVLGLTRGAIRDRN